METITVGSVAAIDLAQPESRAWLDRFAIDNLTFNALQERVRAKRRRAASSFRDDEIIVWQQALHDRYAVIGYDPGSSAYYAIPHDAALPTVAS